MPLNTTTIKSYVLSNLIGLHGNIPKFEIEKFNVINDTVEVKGKFQNQFDYKIYEFTMTIDSQGNAISYDKSIKNPNSLIY